MWKGNKLIIIVYFAKYKQVMTKTYILHIEHKYPFNFLKDNRLQPNTKIKVKRLIPINQMSKELSSKILFANNLRNKNLIKIDSIEQTSQAIEITYEYIEIQDLPKNKKFWENIIHQLQSFTSYLTNIGVKITLKMQKIGLTKQGLLKYYLGLQFDLNQNEEQDLIREHYQQQMNEIRKLYGVELQEQYNEYEIVPYQELHCPSVNGIMSPARVRKSSLVTLPSKIPNISALSKELNKIKTSVKQITQFHYRQDGNQVQKSIENYQTYDGIPKIKGMYPVHFQTSQKKQMNRKYSGDGKAIMQSNRKLSAKFSDFKSDRSKSKEVSHQIVRYEGQNVKSKVQQMKYKQYIQIVSSKNNFMKDFLNVLEDSPVNMIKTEPNISQQLAIAPKSPRKNDFPATASSSYSKNETEMLRLKAQESIKNSLKLINKVKGLS